MIVGCLRFCSDPCRFGVLVIPWTIFFCGYHKIKWRRWDAWRIGSQLAATTIADPGCRTIQPFQVKSLVVCCVWCSADTSETVKSTFKVFVRLVTKYVLHSVNGVWSTMTVWVLLPLFLQAKSSHLMSSTCPSLVRSMVNTALTLQTVGLSLHTVKPGGFFWNCAMSAFSKSSFQAMYGSFLLPLRYFTSSCDTLVTFVPSHSEELEVRKDSVRKQKNKRTKTIKTGHCQWTRALVAPIIWIVSSVYINARMVPRNSGVSK